MEVPAALTLRGSRMLQQARRQVFECQGQAATAATRARPASLAPTVLAVQRHRGAAVCGGQVEQDLGDSLGAEHRQHMLQGGPGSTERADLLELHFALIFL